MFRFILKQIAKQKALYLKKSEKDLLFSADLRHHLKKGTFPKRLKAMRPYPKMETPESQAIVNVACEQVHCVILDQMDLEEEIKLREDQTRYHSMKQEREGEPRKPKMITVVDLQQELKDLQSKYTELCSKLDSKE